MPRILIVEDETLIAMMLEDWLLELGHEPVGPAASVKQALGIVSTTHLDAAILDVNLGHERSDEIAQLAVSRAIPIAFATGGRSDTVASAFAHVPVITKPFDFDAVSRLVDALCAGNAPSARPAEQG